MAKAGGNGRLGVLVVVLLLAAALAVGWIVWSVGRPSASAITDRIELPIPPLPHNPPQSPPSPPRTPPSPPVEPPIVEAGAPS